MSDHRGRHRVARTLGRQPAAFSPSLATQLSAAASRRARQVAYAARRHRSGAIGEVASGVAHELRNPIFGISSAAQLLRFRAREDPVMETNVGRILREVERLNRMVGTLVELGRPIALKLSARRSGRCLGRRARVGAWSPREPRDRDPTNQARHACDRSRSTASSWPRPSGASCRMPSMPLPRQPTLRSNRPRSSQTADGDAGSRTVARRSRRRCCRESSSSFLSTKPGSTGVGLALAQRIVEEHQGTIAIESSAESGHDRVR